MFKVLVVKTSSLGDIIQAFPVVSYIKKKVPSAQLDWAVEAPFSEIVERHPLVHRVLRLQTKQWRRSLSQLSSLKEIGSFLKQLRKERYDLLIDLQGNVKSGLVTYLAHAKKKVGFGWKSAPEWPNTLFTSTRFDPPRGRNIREDYLALAQGFFRETGSFANEGITLSLKQEEEIMLERLLHHPKLQRAPIVVVCPGSAWANKQVTLDALWSFLKKAQEEFGMRFIWIWGNESERRIVQKLYDNFPMTSLIAPKMSLPALQNLMARSNLVVAMDSLPLHLCGTTPTPSFSVFGASLASKYKPIGDQHHALQGFCPYGKVFEKRCPILRTCSTGLCIRGFAGDQLMDSFRSWWLTLHAAV